MESKRPPSSEDLMYLAKELFPDYRQTDMQFNVARRAGETLRSLDMIEGDSRKKVRDRLLVTQTSSLVAERWLTNTLGKRSVPKRQETFPDIIIYQLKPGTRSLMKTLEQAPYEQPYMKKLALKTGLFLRFIHQMDAGMFGIKHTDIAIGYAPEARADDDIIFTVIPPLMDPHVAPTRSLEDIAEEVIPSLNQFMHEDFLKGLGGLDEK